MAGDPYFSKVASLLPFDSEAADYDPHWGKLIGYAELTEELGSELGVAATKTGSVALAAVDGKKAMLLGASSALAFPLLSTIVVNNPHTIEFEVFIVSLTTTQGFISLAAGGIGGTSYVSVGMNTTGQFTWADQGVTLSSSTATTTG